MSHRKTGTIVAFPLTQDRIPGARIGWITRVDSRIPHVDFKGNRHGPLRARVAVGFAPEDFLAAVASRQGAILLFEDADPARPILVGLVQETSETPLLDQILGAPVAEVAQVDGKRVLVEGRDEIVLRCGEASITLRRNGRVSIRGVGIETRASGLQRIRAGKVEIN
jgi:hypothetical protein